MASDTEDDVKKIPLGECSTYGYDNLYPMCLVTENGVKKCLLEPFRNYGLGRYESAYVVFDVPNSGCELLEFINTEAGKKSGFKNLKKINDDFYVVTFGDFISTEIQSYSKKDISNDREKEKDYYLLKRLTEAYGNFKMESTGRIFGKEKITAQEYSYMGNNYAFEIDWLRLYKGPAKFSEACKWYNVDSIRWLINIKTGKMISLRPLGKIGVGDFYHFKSIDSDELRTGNASLKQRILQRVFNGSPTEFNLIRSGEYSVRNGKLIYTDNNSFASIIKVLERFDVPYGVSEVKMQIGDELNYLKLPSTVKKLTKLADGTQVTFNRLELYDDINEFMYDYRINITGKLIIHYDSYESLTLFLERLRNFGVHISFEKEADKTKRKNNMFKRLTVRLCGPELDYSQKKTLERQYLGFSGSQKPWVIYDVESSYKSREGKVVKEPEPEISSIIDTPRDDRDEMTKLSDEIREIYLKYYSDGSARWNKFNSESTSRLQIFIDNSSKSNMTSRELNMYFDSVLNALRNKRISLSRYERYYEIIDFIDKCIVALCGEGMIDYGENAFLKKMIGIGSSKTILETIRESIVEPLKRKLIEERKYIEKYLEECDDNTSIVNPPSFGRLMDYLDVTSFQGYIESEMKDVLSDYDEVYDASETMMEIARDLSLMISSGEFNRDELVGINQRVFDSSRKESIVFLKEKIDAAYASVVAKAEKYSSNPRLAEYYNMAKGVVSFFMKSPVLESADSFAQNMLSSFPGLFDSVASANEYIKRFDTQDDLKLYDNPKIATLIKKYKYVISMIDKIDLKLDELIAGEAELADKVALARRLMEEKK